jgi:demethylspheroidene O-methyltransferase
MSRRPSLTDRLFKWRDDLLANPRIQELTVKLPLLNLIADQRTRSLFRLCTGFVQTQIVTACVELDLLDVLSEGPASADEVGERTGLDAHAAEKLLDAAAAIGLVRRRRDGSYRLDELGAALRGAPGVIEMIRHNQVFYRDIRDPVAILRGQARNTELAEYWPYAEGKPEISDLESKKTEQYSSLMAATQPLIAEDVMAAYPFERHRQLLDVGGGHGAFASAVALRHSKLLVAVLDLPSVASEAEARFETAGIAERATAFGGDFHRDELPPGFDVITLVRILLDHDDEAVRLLLQRVYRAAPPGGTILIAEPMARARNAEAIADAYFGFYLMAMGRGRTRTAEHISRLLSEAGFLEPRVVSTRRALITQLISARKPA